MSQPQKRNPSKPFPADAEKQNRTRSLRHGGTREPMQERHTDPLDLEVPHKLRFVFEDENMMVMEVPLRPYLILGRKVDQSDEQVDVDLNPFNGRDMGVSRYHAILQVSNNRVQIKDYDSTNGTYLNGFVLWPMHSYRLRHGDEISLGRLRMTVYFKNV